MNFTRSAFARRAAVVVLAAFAAALPQIVIAQSDPLTGTWNFVPARSTFTPGPAPYKSATMTFSNAGESQVILEGVANVNAAITPHDPKARQVKKQDDFQYIKDKVFLLAAEGVGVLDKAERTTLEDALDKAVHSLQDDSPVIRGSDMVGVISRQKILEALHAEGNGYVQAVMNRIFEVAQKKESLASAFRKLTARNLSIIPVVEDQRLVGIVTLQNLMHSMALLAESRKLRKEALNP